MLMSVKATAHFDVEISCDDGCGTTATHRAISVSNTMIAGVAARQRMRSIGWRAVDGRDVCPSCAHRYFCESPADGAA